MKRQVPVNREISAQLEEQREAFRQKFGRDPGPDDPIFFDPGADQPAPYPYEKWQQTMIEAMLKAGVYPALIYAFKKTGMLLTAMNRDQWPKRDIQAWNDAVAEYEIHAANGTPPALK